MSMDIIARGLATKNSSQIAAMAQQIRNIHVSYDAPTGDIGKNGDIWFKIKPIAQDYYFRYDAMAITGVEDDKSLYTIEDLSGNGIDLEYDVNKPRYYVSRTNGKPTIWYNASIGSSMKHANFSLPSTEGFTYFFVIQFDEIISESNAIFGIGTASYDNDEAKIISLRKSSSNRLAAKINNTAEVSIPSEQLSTNAMLVSVIYDKSNHSIYKNGVLADTKAYSVSIGTHNQLAIGYDLRMDDPRYFPGCIPEGVFFSRALTPVEFDYWNQNLITKWGIA